jgi:hypothetical protein
MQLLLSRAGLVLNPGQVADLVLAWRQVAGLIASIPHDRPLADDMASAFRLPPPGEARLAAVRSQTVTKGKAKPSPKTKARAKAAPKRRAGKRAPRESARRGQ